MIETILNYIENCNNTKQRFLLIYFKIIKDDYNSQSNSESNSDKSVKVYRHANHIVFDLRNDRALRIEPHGFDRKSFYNQKELDNELKELFTKINETYESKF